MRFGKLAGVTGAALIAVASIAGCGGGDDDPSATVIAKCKEPILGRVNDPASVQYRNIKAERREASAPVTFQKDGTVGFDPKTGDVSKIEMTGREVEKWVVTGEYNSKNSYGGYGTFHRFACDAVRYDKWPKNNGQVDSDGWNILWGDSGPVAS